MATLVFYLDLDYLKLCVSLQNCAEIIHQGCDMINGFSSQNVAYYAHSRQTSSNNYKMDIILHVTNWRFKSLF